MKRYLVRLRVTRVHEHEITAIDEQAAEELALELADEGSIRDSYDDCQFIDAVPMGAE